MYVCKFYAQPVVVSLVVIGTVNTIYIYGTKYYTIFKIK